MEKTCDECAWAIECRSDGKPREEKVCDNFEQARPRRLESVLYCMQQDYFMLPLRRKNTLPRLRTNITQTKLQTVCPHFFSGASFHLESLG